MQLRGKNAKYDFFFEQSQKQGAEITGLGSDANERFFSAVSRGKNKIVAMDSLKRLFKIRTNFEILFIRCVRQTSGSNQDTAFGH